VWCYFGTISPFPIDNLSFASKLPADYWTKLYIEFFADAVDAVMKALVE